MLVGLIADVHSNYVALKMVLSELDKIGARIILHAGDMIGYNPYPNETIELFMKNKIVSILGNHDRALIHRDTSQLNPLASEALEWTAGIISTHNFNYIHGMKSNVICQIGGVRIALFHGSPRDLDEYIYPENAVPEILTITGCDLLVLGHTHVQFKKGFPDGIIMNPGSVGQPRDENPDAAYAIFDTETKKLDLLRISYDIEKVIEDIRSANLPEKLGSRLRLGL